MVAECLTRPKKKSLRDFGETIPLKVKDLGVGLYLCKTIVKMHKGKIWCEDAPLKSGATFCVEIPLKQPFAQVKEADEEGRAGVNFIPVNEQPFALI
uniref:Histidine kinase-, DNA gyrase B-, and HSP90-like ATPase n=1 Tax=Candidatus Kentrum sp. LPFa TaxID=2126335 RepID=A0A450X4Q8_9GAMM|nr:MAG: Histidine kinase-, DNA gyrase B-, and HSP90-like ATPase [Candidatus Kentron sp. LPFa]